MIAAKLAAFVALAVALCTGCGDPRPSCEAASGTWRDADGRSYHLSTNPNGYEMYALFDSARAPGDSAAKPIDGTRYAPVVFDLRIDNGNVHGRRAQRITRNATQCQDHRPITGSCDNGLMRLRYGPATSCTEHGMMAPAAILELRRR